MKPPTELCPDDLKRLLGLAFAKVAEHAVQDGRHDEAQRLCMSGALLAGDPKMTAIPELARISFEAIARSRALCRFVGHSSRVRQAMFCLGERRVITLDADDGLRLWDANSGHELLKTEALEFDLSDDCKTFVTRSRHGVAHVWDADLGRSKGSLSIPGERIKRAGFLRRSDSPFSITEGGELFVWDDADGSYTPKEPPFLLDPDDSEWVVGIGDDNPLVISSALDGLRVRYLDTPSSPYVLLASDDDDLEYVRVSRHGARILSRAGDGTLRLCDVHDGRELLRLDLAEEVEGDATFSPDGRVLLVCKDDGRLALLSANNGASIAVLEEADRCVFSPDSRLIATASDRGLVRLSRTRDGGERVSFQSGTTTPSVMLFSPDSERIAVGERSGLIRVFDATTGEAIFCLNGHDAAIASLVFSGDGRRLLSATADGEARIWCARSGYEVDRNIRHRDVVRQIQFDAAHDLRVVTASKDKTARIWGPLTPTVGLGLVGHTGAVVAAEFSPDGTTVVTASEDTTARLWSPDDGKELRRLEGHKLDLWQATFSPDGSRILTTAADGTAKLWNAYTAEEMWSVQHNDRFVEAAFSSESARFVTCSSGTARVWDLNSLKEVTRVRGGWGTVSKASLTPDGRHIVLITSDRGAGVWSIEESRYIASFGFGDASVRCICLSTNGRLIFAEAADGVAYVWDWCTTDKPVEIRGRKPVWGGVFSPDGSLVATRYGDDEIGVWDAESGLSLCFLGIGGTNVSSISFSPDGAYLGSGFANGAASVWHLATRHIAGKPPADIRVAALMNGLGEQTSAEAKDVLLHAVPRGLLSSVLSNGSRNIGLNISMASATLSAPPHPNCFLSPWQLYGDH